MFIYKFKTSLKCNGCIEKITPGMKEIKGITSWYVGLSPPSATLFVESETDTEEAIINAVRRSGYTIDKIREQ